MTNTGQKLAASGATVVLAESALALAHTGSIGVIVGLAAGFAAYVYADDIARATGRDLASLPTLPKGVPGQPSLAYRLLNGKSTRSAGELGSEEAELFTQDELQDTGSKPFVFSDLLTGNWRPSMKSIFLATTAEGVDIYVPVVDLVHTALAGATRQGKTSIHRLLLAQLCYVGCECVWMDPHFTPYDIETGEDWTPFLPYLQIDPMLFHDYAQIETTIEYAATGLLKKRKEARAKSRSVGKPVFLFMDEYPSIIKERPDVATHVSRLLREGAKYNIFLVIASHDFQVKTTSPKESGAIRDNYKTCYYVGGDTVTAKVLLNVPITDEIESALGKGHTMLRAETCKPAALAVNPMVDNEALYVLLGPSTYAPSNDDGQAAYTPSFAPSVSPSNEQAEKYLVKESSEGAEGASKGLKESKGPMHHVLSVNSASCFFLRRSGSPSEKLRLI